MCAMVTTVFDGLKYFPRQDEIISLQSIFTEHVEFYLPVGYYHLACGRSRGTRLNQVPYMFLNKVFHIKL
jgi:hypothetical protein